ncbi:CHAT domain-containing protein [Kitasatospora sp. NPDC101157]|uniref:CHAT domain-containing protein n=1 Tax=Kitasatospora sp. NPDC101157 TaxID=3364098 RepID=UPI003826EE36
MQTLRIHHRDRDGARVVELGWDGDRVTVPFRPAVDRFLLEDLRWYHENYLENWAAASKGGVARVRRDQRAIGEALYQALFTGDAAALAGGVHAAGDRLRVEIRDDVHDAAVPWELLADPETEEPLVMQAAAFVRTVGDVAEVAPAERAVRRILLVISRPGGAQDIGYWAVAYELWRTLGALPHVKIDVLRPPTYDALIERLCAAAAAGVPYTAVHIDGHGTILNPFGGPQHTGYLVFESPSHDEPDLIDGTTLGHELAANDVLLLTMNACRSADTAGGDRYLRAAPAESTGQPSIAEEVVAAGVPACVGMSREVYPGTPSCFFAAFYTALLNGDSPGAAAREARRRLQAEPFSAGVYRSGSPPVDDWCIPVVIERASVRLAALPGAPARPAGLLDGVPTELGTPAVMGFDQAVLRLEDQLDRARIVLIHGPLLAGKSRLAVEYARWWSSTSPEPRPVTYLRLDGDDAALEGRAPDDLEGGLLVLDQADRAGPAASALVRRAARTGWVIVTARSPDQPWLPEHQHLKPDNLPMGRRALLGAQWARTTGRRYDVQTFRPLVHFCGGMPGVLLLLLNAAYDRVADGVDANEVSKWLKEARWDRLADLGTDAIARVAENAAADLRARLDARELALIPYVARFNGFCDASSVSQLVTVVTGAPVPERVAARLMKRLLAAGLMEESSTHRPGWWLHPLLKLVASRLPQDIDADLDGALITTIASVTKRLTTELFAVPLAVSELLLNHKQNLADTLWMAMERQTVESIVDLTEALCVSCRYEGDVDLAGRVLDRALLHVLERNTLTPQLQAGELAARVWYQAIWVSAYWPYQPRPGQSPLPLLPPEDDHFAAGLYLRSIGDFARALNAFTAEMAEPAARPRYRPGDPDWHIAEIILTAADDALLPTGLDHVRRSLEARPPEDVLGQATSRVLEARLRFRSLTTGDLFADELLPLEDAAALDEIAALVKEAMAEQGGRSAENRSHAEMIFSFVLLGRGELTRAVGAFEHSVPELIRLRDPNLWQYLWRFARNLLHYGWISRGHETAVAAFHSARQTGGALWEVPTRIREFNQRLEATHPELRT